MTASRRASSRLALQLGATVLAVAILLAGVYAFMTWQRSQPGLPVEDLRIHVTASDGEHEIAPYTLCPLDEQCDGGEPPALTRGGSDELKFRIDPDIAAGSWRLLLIYDDPSANEERLHQAGETTEETAPAVKEGGAKLLVAEVSTLAVKNDDHGEEIPVVATWSVAFE
ncbi:DUF2771 domain-containing protein [Corynebacterium sp. HMSC08D02]|uniref:DUF2771 domain-containing protein n=1 Tax=Corynebacterium sp. HMSC08D02 TaxID=1581138 RepID=UPI0008A302E8|nr:DUF2771 domain-containing protein [Corynebacterium sp. HMSC08D02]OFT28451.1 hypothetical protein HMPREF3170_08970 [Corynebacterium sp. HMSC08D02]